MPNGILKKSFLKKLNSQNNNKKETKFLYFPNLNKIKEKVAFRVWAWMKWGGSLGAVSVSDPTSFGEIHRLFPDTEIFVWLSEAHPAAASTPAGRSWGPCFPVNHYKTTVSTWAHSLAWGNKDVSHPLIRGWQVTHLTPEMGNTWLINCLVTHPATLTPTKMLTPAAHPSMTLTFEGGGKGSGQEFWGGQGRQKNSDQREGIQRESETERPGAKASYLGWKFLDFLWSVSHKHKAWNVVKEILSLSGCV